VEITHKNWLSGEIEDEYPKGIKLRDLGVMNSDTAINFLKKGFHVTLGATTSLVEAIQDPIKREETLSQMRLGPNEWVDLFAEKGAVTEGEARKIVDGVMAQYAPNTTSSTGKTTSPYPNPVVDPSLQQDLRELTTQLLELRTQLAQKSDEGNI
jgi:polyhydroxyalkanoate synthesis regulator phasin